MGDTDKNAIERLQDVVDEENLPDQLVPVADKFVQEFVPGGGILTTVLTKMTGREKLSTKMLPVYIEFISDDLNKIAKKAEELSEKCDATEADIAAILKAIDAASQKTADAEKRNLLRLAARRAYEPEIFEQGQVLEFLETVRDVSFGGVSLLRRIHGDAEEKDGNMRLDLWNDRPKESNHPLYRKLASSVTRERRRVEHLIDLGLLYTSDRRDFKSVYVTEYGRDFLKFLTE